MSALDSFSQSTQERALFYRALRIESHENGTGVNIDEDEFDKLLDKIGADFSFDDLDTNGDGTINEYDIGEGDENHALRHAIRSGEGLSDSDIKNALMNAMQMDSGLSSNIVSGSEDGLPEVTGAGPNSSEDGLPEVTGNNDIQGSNTESSDTRFTGNPPSDAMHTEWGGEEIDIWAITKNNATESGRTNGASAFLVTVNDTNLSTVKSMAEKAGYNVIETGGKSDAGALFLRPTANADPMAFEKILDFGKVTVAAVNEPEGKRLKPRDGAFEPKKLPSGMGFGTTDNTNTTGEFFHNTSDNKVIIKNGEDDMRVWKDSDDMNHFRGGSLSFDWVDGPLLFDNPVPVAESNSVGGTGSDSVKISDKSLDELVLDFAQKPGATVVFDFDKTLFKDGFFEGADKVIKKLVDNGINIAVLSSNPNTNDDLQKSLKTNYPDIFTDEFLASDAFHANAAFDSDPNDAVDLSTKTDEMQKILDHYDVKSENVIFFDDLEKNINDIEGEFPGIHSIHVNEAKGVTEADFREGLISAFSPGTLPSEGTPTGSNVTPPSETKPTEPPQPSRPSDTVDPSTMTGKIMTGYQGWFFTPGDGSEKDWTHWSDGSNPSSRSVGIDYWPDLREYDEDELTGTALKYEDGEVAGLYSAYNPKTVDRHFSWMKEYGVDGAWIQRFFTDMTDPRGRAARDQVLRNSMQGAEAHGRTFGNMWDISGFGGVESVEKIKQDWMHLVDDLKITESPNYQQHNGLPVVSIWGYGVRDNTSSDADARAFEELIDWFHNEAPPQYRASVMAGVDDDWRSHSSAWQNAYEKLDVLSPWSVGRYGNEEEADQWQENKIKPDMASLENSDTDYMPVVFPGFSWANTKEDTNSPSTYTHNFIPREGGDFYWQQMHNAMESGAEMIYVAMFDEVDEGTAIFKLAENDSQTPTTGTFVTLDEDGEDLPSDWYLRLTGEAGRMLRGEIDLTDDVPIDR